uniref:Uncharacterized protein n=1 Tax=Picea glauca TaxID=3330 RepID=A0A101LXM0_PICGL|nr:hypothetical protein ABT39_MTgene6205 [Picea glauca]
MILEHEEASRIDISFVRPLAGIFCYLLGTYPRPVLFGPLVQAGWVKSNSTQVGTSSYQSGWVRTTKNGQRSWSWYRSYIR